MYSIIYSKQVAEGGFEQQFAWLQAHAPHHVVLPLHFLLAPRVIAPHVSIK